MVQVRHVAKQGLISAPEIRRQLDKYIPPTWERTPSSLRFWRGNVTALLLDDIEDENSPRPWPTRCWRPCGGS